MTRVAMFGLGPMRWEQSTRLFALPLRTWHFAATLARDRHQVVLFSMRTAAFEGWPPEKVTRVERDGVVVYSLSEHLLHERPDWVRAQLQELSPECIVGVNRDPAALAANFADELPFWADINGDPMAEAQAKAEVVGSDAWTPEFYRRFVPVLMRADRFSTCSNPQRAALIGQLAMIGRLTGPNASADLVHAVPNSIDDGELARFSAIERRPRNPDDPFVLLWSGGYNTWCDPDLLYEAVDRAMTESPALRFVSTGGAIEGHYTDGFDRFRARVAASGHADRYHFAGWVQTAELPAYYADAHAAVLTDRFGYEGLLGARTRMLDWLAAGLPVVSTRLSEISHDVEREGAGLCSPCGDVDAMVDNILRLVREPELAVTYGEAGRAYARRELRASRQLEALREWAARPERAPDGERRLTLPRHGAAGNEVRSLARQWVESTRRGGIRGGLDDARRFASRRARNTVRRALDRAGLPGGVRVIELDATAAPEHEAPRAGALQWRRKLANGAGGPTAAVVLFVRPDDDLEVLGWTIAQVQRQYFERWTLVIAHQSGVGLGPTVPDEAIVLDATRGNPLEHRAVRQADYVMLLGVGDLLRPDALAELTFAAKEHDADLVYADEQAVDETNAPRPVTKKPEWSTDALFGEPFLGRCAVFKSGRVALTPEHAANWPVEALAYEVALRASDEPLSAMRVPRVLSQRFVPVRASEAALEREREAAERSLTALRDTLWRRELEATAARGARAGTFRVDWALPPGVTLTLAVPVEGPTDRLERCLRALRERSRLTGLKVVLAAKPGALPTEGIAMHHSEGNVRARVHATLEHAETDLVGWLLPEAEVVKDGWAEHLARQACREGVGAAGPRLLEPSGRATWPRGGAADHPEDADGLPLQCVVLRREKYAAAGGLAAEGSVSMKRAVDALAANLRAEDARLVCASNAAAYVHPEPVGDRAVVTPH